VLIICKDLDSVNRKICEGAGWIAYDPKIGAYLRKVTGQSGRYILMSVGMALVIEAGSDENAIEEANRGLG
jgi:hypothetical protein